MARVGSSQTLFWSSGGIVTVRRVINGIWIFAVLALILSYLIYELSGAERDVSGEIAKAGELDAVEFRVGDCLESLDEIQASTAEEYLVSSGAAVPCNTPHEYEIYAETWLPQSTPYSAELVEISLDYCESQFEAFAGASYLETTLEIDTIFPSQESHLEGDRKVQCLISEMGDNRSLTNSLKGRGEEYGLLSSSGNPLQFDLVGTPTGTCFNIYEHPVFGMAYEAVGCENPHEMELFFNSPLYGAAAGDLDLASEEKCVEEFEAYLEISWERSKYSFTYVSPEELSSDGVESALICFAVSGDGSPLIGTLKGAKS